MIFDMLVIPERELTVLVLVTGAEMFLTCVLNVNMTLSPVALQIKQPPGLHSKNMAPTAHGLLSEKKFKVKLIKGIVTFT